MSGRACPQAVYTSARRTLEGPGFGVFALSPDWPAELGRTRTALGALVGFAAEAGEAFGVVQRDAGRVLFRKVAVRADGFGRDGNYLVHLLWDDSDRLGVRDLLGLRRAGRFLDALPDGASPTRDLPPLRVPFAPRTPPALTTDEIEALTPGLALLLAALAAGEGAVALPRRTAAGRAPADVVFDVLPRALTAAVTLRCGAPGDAGDRAAVTVQLDDVPVARAAAGGRRLAAEAIDTERARTLLEAASKGELPPDECADLHRLDRWLFAGTWAEQDAAELTAEQVACVLESDAAPRWLDRGGNARAALDAVATSRPLGAALRAAVERHPGAAARVRAEVLRALLDEVFDGAAGPEEQAVELAGLTQGDLCAALADAAAAGRRIAHLDPAAGLLVEQALSLGFPLPLLSLTGDHWELALLAGRRPVVGDALAEQWRASWTAWDEQHRALLGHLLVADVGWLDRLADAVPPSGLPAVLRWASLRLDVPGVERLAAAVATGATAGNGWALREVVFGAELPPAEVAGILDRHLALLLADDGWPRAVAEALARGPADGTPARRGRRSRRG
ncbi:hypothetical protein [Geodermatophilus ruber]|uniref:GTPase-associated protein 1 N-terminal domain-containing protein n=1 Tax=Geodermatophilus ruber TaxID=504800 RepID=A0A1I4HAW5_9ACTN|nr:hypothetical protein [Geodermatophilus ruber]SFL38747.1 hypothetical protein SAMN04488085_11093 [Geodermatophilus ruber]